VTLVGVILMVVQVSSLSRDLSNLGDSSSSSSSSNCFSQGGTDPSC
jgi:hypothetical protein